MNDQLSKSDTVKSFKIILVGSSAVGKSTLLVRYIDDTFNPQKPTVGLDYRSKKITLNGETFNMELWDSAGQERYRTIVFNYFKLSKAACVVFDLTVPQSLEETKFWFKQVNNHCGGLIPKILIGNKSDLLKDLGGKEEVDTHMNSIMPQINEIEKEFGAKFFMMSAYTGEGVSEAFDYLFNELYKQYGGAKASDKKPANGFALADKPMNLKDTKKDKKCCA